MIKTENLFDPVELAKRTGKIVCDGNRRKYFRFGNTPDYKTGVATGYVVGCNLRCVFCWAHETRDNLEKVNKYFSPAEVFGILTEYMQKNRSISQVRISDGEPTIGRDHLLELIELTERSDTERFILETNGILLGHDESYVKDLSGFRKLYVRVDLKAGTPEAFSSKTGAMPEAFDLPFRAISLLREHRMNFGVAAMSADPRFMDPLERVSLVIRLGQIDPSLVLKLEEEMTILFPTTLKRLAAKGWNMRPVKYPACIPGPLRKYFQVSYRPIRSLKKQKLSLNFTIKNIKQLFHGI